MLKIKAGAKASVLLNKNMKDKWKTNAGYFLGTHPILAALSGILIGVIIQDHFFDNSWKLPIALLSLAFLFFVLSVEKTTDAFDEDDVRKYLFYLLLFNLGVILLIWGMALVISIRYAFKPVWFNITVFFITLPWLLDIMYLIFEPEEKFEEYIQELREGKGKEDRGLFTKIFYCIRKIINEAYKLIAILLLKVAKYLFPNINYYSAILPPKLPHRDVFTRLGVSKIHGVGVFAIKNIPKGINVFSGDDEEMIWIDKEDIEYAEPEIQKLYDDFCIIKDNKFGCPKSFNQLTVGWYINSSNDPNVEIREDSNFYALRDINKGEELTSNYDTYSDEKNRIGENFK